MASIKPAEVARLSAVCGIAALASLLLLRRIFGADLRELPVGETVFYALLFDSAASAVMLASGWAVLTRRLASLGCCAVFLGGLTGRPSVYAVGLFCGCIVICCFHFADAAEPPRGPGAATGRHRATPADETGETSRSLEEENAEENAAPAIVPPHGRLAGESRTEVASRSRSLPDSQEGVIPFEIPPHQRSTTIHIPFTPAFASAPVVTYELEGIDGRARSVTMKPYGVRVEVGTDEEFDEPLAGELRYRATAMPLNSESTVRSGSG